MLWRTCRELPEVARAALTRQRSTATGFALRIQSCHPVGGVLAIIRRLRVGNRLQAKSVV
jgi:hypothetical protein